MLMGEIPSPIGSHCQRYEAILPFKLPVDSLSNPTEESRRRYTRPPEAVTLSMRVVIE